MNGQHRVSIGSPQTAQEMNRLVKYLEGVNVIKSQPYYVVLDSMKAGGFMRRPPSFQFHFWFDYIHDAQRFAREWGGEFEE